MMRGAGARRERWLFVKRVKEENYLHYVLLHGEFAFINPAKKLKFRQTDLPLSSILSIFPRHILLFSSVLMSSALDTHCMYSSSTDGVSLIHDAVLKKQTKSLYFTEMEGDHNSLEIKAMQ